MLQIFGKETLKKDHLGELGVARTKVLKQDVRIFTEFIWLWMGPIIACLEHGDEKFDYIEEGCTNLKKNL